MTESGLTILTVDLSPTGDASASLYDGSVSSGQQKVRYAINLVMARKLTEMVYAAIRENDMAAAEQTGKTLAGLVLPKEIRERLPAGGEALVLSTNAQEIPWELLWDRAFFGVRFALGRQLLTTKDVRRAPIPADVEEQRAPAKKSCLVITNPTGDLPEAQREAVKLMRFFRDSGVSCTLIAGAQITSADLLVRLGSGNYDIIHYSGHIDIDRDGAYLRLAGEDRFYLKDVLHLDDFGRPFVFLNGCAPQGKSEEVAAPLIYAGSGPILCASAPISDGGGRDFAESIIENVLRGVPYGRATMEARRKLCYSTEAGMDWMCFAFYGNPHDTMSGCGEESSASPLGRTLGGALARVLGRADGLTKDVYVISTSHLFISLLMEGDAEILRAFQEAGYDARLIETIIAAIFRAPTTPEIRPLPDNDRYSENALAALESAREEAAGKRRETTPRDLLATLISSPNMLTQILESVGVDSGRLWERLQKP